MFRMYSQSIRDFWRRPRIMSHEALDYSGPIVMPFEMEGCPAGTAAHVSSRCDIVARWRPMPRYFLLLTRLFLARCDVGITWL